MDKNKLVSQISDVIHAIPTDAACCSNCDDHILGKDNKKVRELCRLLDCLFSHGLSKKEDGYWPFVKEIISKAEANEILSFWNPKTPRGRSLAWLYSCINDNSLEFYFCSLPSNYNLITKYYSKSAVLADKQVIKRIGMFLRELDGVKIYLEPKNRSKAHDHSVTRPGGCSLNKNPPAMPSDENKIETVSNNVVVVRANISNRNPSFATLEQSVADFSGCPDVLGFSAADSDLFISGTELSVDAMEYEYPQDDNRAWYKTGALHCVVLKRRPMSTAFSKSVPKIVDSGSDQGGLLVGSLETSNNYMNVAPPHDFNSTEMVCSTPLTPNDADFMLKAILKGPHPPKLNHTSTLLPRDQDASSQSSMLNHIHEDTNTTENVGANENDSTGNPLDIDAIHHSVATNGVVDSQAMDTNETQETEQPSRQYTEFEKRLFYRLQHVMDEESQRKKRSRENASSSETESVHQMQEDNQSDLNKLKARSESNYDTNGNMNERSANEDSISILSPSETGELRLDSCEILELTTNVMHDGEQYFKMYRVYLNHHMGSPLLRYLLISNKCLYILIAKPNSTSNTTNENGLTKKESDKDLPATVYGAYYYVVDHRIPFEKLDYITVGMNGQFFDVHTRMKRQGYLICTACDVYTKSILSNLEFSIRRLNSNKQLQLPNIYNEYTPQTICLKKWILGETGKDEDKICLYALAYWNPNMSKTRFSSLSSSGSTTRNGYLYERIYYPNSWLKKSTEWQQSFFILQGKKFYQFEDMSCKVGLKIYNLQTDIITCRQTETTEHTYCLELCLKDDSTVVQLACPTRHELQQWMCAFDTTATSCSCSACCLVVTEHYLLIGQETSSIGFIRTLALSRLDALAEFKICRAFCSIVMTIALSSNSEKYECWLICFASRSELDVFINALKQTSRGKISSVLMEIVDQLREHRTALIDWIPFLCSLVREMEIEEIDDSFHQWSAIDECYQHWTNMKSC